MVRRKIRFSLATLAMVLTISAVLLGLWVRNFQPRRAQVAWLNPASAEAQEICRQSEFSTEGTRHQLTFRPRYATIAAAFRPISPSLKAKTDTWATNDLFHRIELDSSDPPKVRNVCDQLRQVDVLAPGTIAINGIVEDQRRQPVDYVWVDLLGPKSIIGQCITRSDGTFTMILDVPPEPGYFIRLRYGENPFAESETAHTPKFTLQSQRELIVRIRIPIP